MARWGDLCSCIDSLERQTVAPLEILIVIDGPPLLESARERWNDRRSGIPVRVLKNLAGTGLGGARNTGVKGATGDIVAFLDDDATADADWVERMVEPYREETVVAVGGSPRAAMDVPRPIWWPEEFDWVVGCAYKGLPNRLEDMGHMIGAAMSARRSALNAVGGFHADALDDLDLSLRLAASFPGQHVVYEPRATVRHRVPAERLTWHYFWRRCYTENRRKAGVLKNMGGGGSLGTERRYLTKTLTVAAFEGLTDGMRCRRGGFARAGAIVAGVTLASMGYGIGLAEWVTGSCSGNGSGSAPPRVSCREGRDSEEVAGE
jgi:glucosyl-dolichyl phosphate glucuronosyltransferase